MLLTGLTYVRNAVKYDYPFRESCLSAIPICDEFIIALDEGGLDDGTLDIAVQLERDHHNVALMPCDWWDIEKRNIALAGPIDDLVESVVNGDYYFYIQADEALHENERLAIRAFAEMEMGDWATLGHIDFYRRFHERIPDDHHLRRARVARKDSHPHIAVFDDGACLYAHTNHGKTLKHVDLTDKVSLYHYGTMRKRRQLCMKHREVGALVGWAPSVLAGLDDAIAGPSHEVGWDDRRTVPFLGTHPAVMQQWIAERREAVERGLVE